MKLIFISGPSGSGKTTLSNQIVLKNKDGFILSTDNYYKTGLISKLLSRFIDGYFDRSISFNFKLFKEDFDYIFKNQIAIHNRYYDFKKQHFTEEEILSKEVSLRHMLKPVTRYGLIKELKDAGFKTIEVFWQQFNFVGVLGIK